MIVRCASDSAAPRDKPSRRNSSCRRASPPRKKSTITFLTRFLPREANGGGTLRLVVLPLGCTPDVGCVFKPVLAIGVPAAVSHARFADLRQHGEVARSRVPDRCGLHGGGGRGARARGRYARPL